MDLRPKTRGRLLYFYILLIFTFSDCDPERTSREKVSLQYLNDRKMRLQELEPAEGYYLGTLFLFEGAKSYPFKLVLSRVDSIERAPQSQTPTEMIEIPKLSGSLSFPILDGYSLEIYSRYPELLRPMGGYTRITIDHGDYIPLSHRLILPYSVPGSSAQTFGELSAVLDGEHLKGSWFVSAFGTVAEFEADRVPIEFPRQPVELTPEP